MDIHMKKLVDGDNYLKDLGVRTTGQGQKGPDFMLTESAQEVPNGKELQTREAITWWDLTTQNQASPHIQRYGATPGMTKAEQILGYGHDKWVGLTKDQQNLDFYGKVKVIDPVK